jgi:hypothetical protein
VQGRNAPIQTQLKQSNSLSSTQHQAQLQPQQVQNASRTPQQHAISKDETFANYCER